MTIEVKLFVAWIISSFIWGIILMIINWKSGTIDSNDFVVPIFGSFLIMFLYYLVFKYL
jgi:hypothetical protein